MKAFHCDHCQNLAFFENTQCTNCHRLLAYLPDLKAMASLESGTGRHLDFAVAAGQGPGVPAVSELQRRGDMQLGYSGRRLQPTVLSCRLTQVIPNLSRPGSIEHWQRMEAPKRRLLYGLTQLGLSARSKTEDPDNAWRSSSAPMRTHLTPSRR